jgi:hypothetical protein
MHWRLYQHAAEHLLLLLQKATAKLLQDHLQARFDCPRDQHTPLLTSSTGHFTCSPMWFDLAVALVSTSAQNINTAHRR